MTYEQFEKECNRLLTVKVGLGIHDLADACWRDYYDDGMCVIDALQTANDDHWDNDLDQFLYG